jgi:hypothetical protein
MVANSKSTSNLNGWTPSHAYTILNNYVVTLTGGAQVKLIKLRNPIGTDEPFGMAYLDDSDALWNNVSA